MMRKKGQLWISAVLYVLVIVVVIVIVIEALTPVIENLKDKSIYNRIRDSFITLNEYVRDVSSEGKGSQRTIPIEVQKGVFSVEENEIKWTFETDSQILEPRTQVELGNLLVVSNGDVDAYETNRSTFVLKNSNVLFEFYKYGSPLNYMNYTNVSGTIVDFTGGNFLKTTSYIRGATQINVTPSFAFYVPPDTSASRINGYTALLRKGSGLGKAKLISHVITANYEYDLVFTLESQSDYLEVEMVKDLT